MSDLYGWLGEGVGSEDEWRVLGQLLSVNTVLVKKCSQHFLKCQFYINLSSSA